MRVYSVRSINSHYSIRRFFCCLIFCFKSISGRKTTIKKDFQINDQIRDRQVRLIADDGAQLGVVALDKALTMAFEQNLDLVKISPNAVPPVCKIMDYGKFKFENAKKEKEARKNQKTVDLKEIWLSMTIDIHDLNVKAKSAQKFISDGDKVKVSIRMKGRQQAHPELGLEVMNKFFQMLQDVCVMEKQPLKEGRNILMILSPKTK